MTRAIPKVVLCSAIIALLSGCSSMSIIYVRNGTAHSCMVEVSVVLPTPKPNAKETLSLDPGTTGRGPGWFSDIPSEVDVSIDDKGALRHFTLRPGAFPDAMKVRTSAGGPIHLEILDSGVTLTGPTFEDRVTENGPLIAVAFLCFVAPALLLISRMRKPSKA